MKVEIPELKRCCLCVPLRYGLLAFGYLKLILDVALLTILSFILRRFLGTLYEYVHTWDIVLAIVLLLVLATDFCFNIIFLVGGHRKSVKLLHMYYIYNIVALVLYVLFFTWSTASELVAMRQYADFMPHGYASFIPLLQVGLLVGLSNIGLQSYIILLIRSEVIKLRNVTNYRFTNLQAEAERSLENGSNKQEINHTNETTTDNGTDNQFAGIINLTKKSDQNSFSYKKF